MSDPNDPLKTPAGFVAIATIAALCVAAAGYAIITLIL